MFNEIQSKIHDYEKLTSKKPTRLLVGRETGKILMRLCEEFIVLKPCNTGIRDKIFGLPIYVMDDDYYLEVAP